MSIYYAPKTAAIRLSAISLSVVLLSACATSSNEPSIIPDQTADITSKEGLFTQPLIFDSKKSNCIGDCPTLHVESLVFPGNKPLTDYVDKQLAKMMQLDDKNKNYLTVKAFTQFFLSQAGPRDEALLFTKPRYKNKDLTVLELGVWHYVTGAAHGAGKTQFVNWDNQKKQALLFTDVVMSNQKSAFNDRLMQAHQIWLTKQVQEKNIDNLTEHLRLWPFQPTENIALTDAGIVAKYNSYDIAPYYFGQPELFIAYPELRGILQPKYLPN